MDEIYKNESGSMQDIIEKFIQGNQGCTHNEVCSWARKNTTPVEGRGHMESITRALDDLMGLNYEELLQLPSLYSSLLHNMD